MDKVSKVMDEYFKTVTPERLERDLIEAGIENCPDKCERFGHAEWDVGSCVDCSVEHEWYWRECINEGYKNIPINVWFERNRKIK